MKRCPKCNRSFPDDNQKFCTIDGGLLVTGDKPFDPNATIQSPLNRAIPVESPGDKPVSKQPPDWNETIGINESIAAAAPTAVLPRQTGPTGSTTEPNLPPAPPPVSPQTAPASPPPSAPPPQAPGASLPQAPSAPAAPGTGAPPKTKSKLPLILGVLALLLVFGVGALAAAAYFFVIKPRREAMQPEPPIVVSKSENENVNSNTNTTPNTEPAKTESEKTESEFVAPPNTTRFTNSPANLEGKLAEHYFEFSFYYPDNWVVDPKAGTAASGNFAKVERRLPPDFTQENFAVRWYESKGTFASDLPDYPTQVEEFSASLAKAFPEYHKVSEGPTKINSLDAYEFRWVGASKGTVKGDLQLWGRVVFVPTGVEGDRTGAILTMFTTSLAPELSGVEDVGEKGQSPVILESFRYGKIR